MALTDKQARFVAEYLVDLNATQAAIRAGYSPDTAYSIGSENLKKPEIAAAVDEGRQASLRALGITRERVLEEMARIGFSDIRKAVRWGASVAVPWTGGEAGEVDPETGEPCRVHHPIALVDSDEVDDATAAAISEVALTKEGLRVKFHDKLGALDRIAKHLGLYAPTKHEHTGRDGAPIAVADATPLDVARRLAFVLAKGAATSPKKD